MIAAHVAALRRLDDRHGGGTLSLLYVSSELRNVVDLVRWADYEPKVGRRLLAIVADLAQLVGWLHFDSGAYGAAERYLLLSVRIANSLAERGRAANAVGMLAYVSAFAGHGIEALRVADAAALLCPPGDRLLEARILGRVATAAAAAGDLSRFRESTETARDLVAFGRTGDLPTFLYYLEPVQLVAEAGQGLVVLAGHVTVCRKQLLREAVELVAPISGELRTLHPGDVVIERGQFREDVACASIATPADDPVGWWALGVSTRGLDLPDPLLTQLRSAAADLAAT